MKRAALDRLLADRAARRPAALLTDLATGAQSLFHPDEPASAPADAALADAARAALAADRCEVFEGPAGRVFVHAFPAPARLVVVGAVHVAQPLSRMAALAGFDVTVVDPRRSFASAARFPDVALVPVWPDEALRELRLDARTAVVTLTHDPKLDDPALAAALRSPCGYVGALGSRRTQAARLARLRALGFSDADLARIHGPVGLAIGARTPAEIAVAILAELIAALRSAPGAGGG